MAFHTVRTSLLVGKCQRLIVRWLPNDITRTVAAGEDAFSRSEGCLLARHGAWLVALSYGSSDVRLLP